MSALATAFADGIRPDPPLTVSEWADKHRVLSQEASAEPGRWRTSRTPYLREIMDALSPGSGVERVTFMKGAQIGGTEAGNNWAGYVMDHAPGPMLIVQAKDQLVGRVSKQRLTPMIENSPRLSAKVYKDNVEEKHFPGGILMLTTAKSASGLRSMPIRYLFLDEVDGYPLDVQGEGDPVNLAIARTRTFARRKILEVSTPTIADVSRIEHAYKRSDQRRYLVPCPHCDQMQTIEFDRLRWKDSDPTTVAMECEGCNELVTEAHKTEMLDRGEWRPTSEPESGAHQGYHLSALYSPVGFYSWESAVSEFLEAKKNPDKLRTFVNTVLGETWEQRGEAPEYERLMQRRETYQPGKVPEGALVLTAGVDVQKDRIEALVLGWGPGLECWVIEHEVFAGDVYEGEVWEQLTEFIGRRYTHELGGTLELSKVAVDSGFATQEVYRWARFQSAQKVIVVKGSDRQDRLVGSRSRVDIEIDGRRRKSGLGVWTVGSSAGKSELYGKLRLNPERNDEGETIGYPPGFVHFPELAPEFFKQLTAEKQVVKKSRGYQKVVWEKTRERNEALDMWVYARAAAALEKVDQYEDKHWAALRDEREQQSKPEKKQQSKRERRRERREESFWKDRDKGFW
jgi:phage terminase large subunit GpA-like protein